MNESFVVGDIVVLKGTNEFKLVVIKTDGNPRGESDFAYLNNVSGLIEITTLPNASVIKTE